MDVLDALAGAVAGAILSGLVQWWSLRLQERREREAVLVMVASDVVSIASFMRMQNYAARYADAETLGDFVVIDACQDYLAFSQSVVPLLGKLEPKHVAHIRSFYFWAMIALDTARPDSRFSGNPRNGRFMAWLCQYLLQLADTIAQYPRDPIVAPSLTLGAPS